MIEFLTSGEAPASCPGSREAQALALPPSSLAHLRPGTSRSRLAGKVAGAAAITLEDVFGQTSFAGGGLRGGYWIRRAEGFALHGMVDVRGVAVSGNVRVAEGALGALELTAHLTVGGRLSGKLVLHGLGLSGRVGGAPVHARLSAL